MIIRVIDFETTGMPPDAAVCEIGWCDLVLGDGPTMITPVQAMFVNPNRPMPIEAMAVHHIRDWDVANAPPITDGFMRIADGADVFAAHNAVFERSFFSGNEMPWICTYRCGLRAWPESPVHSNQGLRYFLTLDLGEEAMPPHRAGPDAYVTAHILRALLGVQPSDVLIKWTSEPALLVKCGFGKHRGQKWAEVPSDYLEWLLRQRDMGEDIHHTARHHLRQRRRQTVPA
jgi:exodeoxyribonuclease X